MLPLAIANASSTLVAQQVGAGDSADARRIGWAGLEIGVGVAALVGGAVYFLREQVVGLYTANPVIVAAALPLLAWVALFHVADAAQTVAATRARTAASASVCPRYSARMVRRSSGERLSPAIDSAARVFARMATVLAGSAIDVADRRKRPSAWPTRCATWCASRAWRCATRCCRTTSRSRRKSSTR